MHTIDRPFRFTRDFYVVWLLLMAPTFLLSRRHDFGPWYSQVSLLIVASLCATFALYGPVLLFGQVIRSGARGWLVGRVLLSILLVAFLLFGGLFVSGLYTESRVRVLAFVFIVAATVYLHWRRKS
jgi:hypothetical protein